tara:strand:+ start:338 stop:484 length:147 start_codon:yes stop_codon:yes gene_type:complete
MDYRELEKSLHKLETKMNKIKQLVEQYPNDMHLGEKIRFYIKKIGDTQ